MVQVVFLLFDEVGEICNLESRGEEIRGVERRFDEVGGERREFVVRPVAEGLP